MCGIFGYIGDNNALPFLVSGLEKLEYRGYDSAGIYIPEIRNKKNILIKSKGKVKNLKEKVQSYPDKIFGRLGIAHTRWATHGKPSIENAHPQVSEDKRFYLVHNGVIENYLQLKKKYLKDIELKSQTDTEVAVQLVAKFVKNGLDTLSAFRKMISLLNKDSTYAFLMIDSYNPNVLFVAKSKSPLLIGFSKQAKVVTSDALAALNITKDFIDLRDSEIAIVSHKKIDLYDDNGNKIVDKKSFHINADPSATKKGIYPFYMLKEINEQAIVIRELISHYFSDKKPIINKDILSSIKQADRLYIIAAGTSYHAGLIGRRFFEKWAHIPTEVHVASEFAYDEPLLSKNPFFIFLSQSGETADSRQSLGLIRHQGYKSLTIANVLDSTLCREADYSLPIMAGPEIAVASTKAYTAAIVTQIILASALSNQDNGDLRTQLSKLAIKMQSVLDNKTKIKNIADRYLVNTDRVFYIGRGADADLSLEAALKLKEITYTLVEAFPSGELKHGTISLVEKGTPVIALVSQNKTAGLTRSNLEETLARGAKTITIVTKGLSMEGDNLILPEMSGEMEKFAPILEAIPIQLLAYYVAIGRKLNVDQPRNLAKSVTVQ